MFRRYEPELRDENGTVIQATIDEAENYLDYFHSQLHVSPDGESFLSNGWVWHPYDNIIAFRVAEFLERYELSSTDTEFGGGYNWDRPCAFIDDDRFAVIVADLVEERVESSEPYLPLWLYRMSDRPPPGDRRRQLKAYAKLPCEAFATDKHGEVHGDLYFDPRRNCLVGIGSKGGCLISLDGTIVAHDPEVARTDPTMHSDVGSRYANAAAEWKYSVRGQFFFRFDREHRRVERRAF